MKNIKALPSVYRRLKSHIVFSQNAGYRSTPSHRAGRRRTPRSASWLLLCRRYPNTSRQINQRIRKDREEEGSEIREGRQEKLYTLYLCGAM